MVEILFGGFRDIEASGRSDSRVADQNVEMSKSIERAAKKLLAVGRFRHVSTDGAELLFARTGDVLAGEDGVLGGTAIGAVMHGDAQAGTGEFDSGSPAEAATGSGDERNRWFDFGHGLTIVAKLVWIR